MRYVVALTVVALVAVLWPFPRSAGAEQVPMWFKTPGGAAYCGFTDSGWRCMRPTDGFRIELTNVYLDKGDAVGVKQGYSPSYRGVRRNDVSKLGFGHRLESSDARAITCWSRRDGVTCKSLTGLSFRLGRVAGYRIYYDIPGYRRAVRPLFRTRDGVWCGVDRDTFVPEKPDLLCWRPTDGPVVGVDTHHPRGYNYRDEHQLRYRPIGFPLLRPEHTFTWRCRRMTDETAERCSPTTGLPVFTCRHDAARLTCTNRIGGGFWVNSQAFAVF